MEASMSTIFKTVIWNSLSLLNKYILHKNKSFFKFDVKSELCQPKHIKIDVLKNLIYTL